MERRVRVEPEYTMAAWLGLMIVAIGLPLDNDMKGSLVGIVWYVG